MADDVFAQGAGTAVGLVAFGLGQATLSNMFSELRRQRIVPRQVYLVDNGMNCQLDEIAGDACIIDAGYNAGFAKGANLAAEQAWSDGYQRMLLLNFDVEFLRSSAVSRLEEALESSVDCAFVSPIVVFASDKGRVWYRGGRLWRPSWITTHPGMGSPYLGTDEMKITDYFSGCCVLLDLAVFQSLGGFNERLFMYYEEPELCARARMVAKHAAVLDLGLVAHRKSGRKLDELEAFQLARNARMLCNEYERGWRRLLGRLLQWLVVPAQLFRCSNRSAAAAYVRGVSGLGEESIDRAVAARIKGS